MPSRTSDDENPAWSPEGKRIVFPRDLYAVRGEVDLDILTMKAKGHEQSRRNKSLSPVGS